MLVSVIWCESAMSTRMYPPRTSLPPFTHKDVFKGKEHCLHAYSEDQPLTTQKPASSQRQEQQELIPLLIILGYVKRKKVQRCGRLWKDLVRLVPGEPVSHLKLRVTSSYMMQLRCSHPLSPKALWVSESLPAITNGSLTSSFITVCTLTPLNLKLNTK